MSEVEAHEAAPEQPAVQFFEMHFVGEDFAAASHKASVLLDLMFQTRPKEEVVKALLLNTHGLLTALVPYIGAETIKTFMRDTLEKNLDAVQTYVNEADAAEATKH